ncbi:GntR family transcriptional regulator [Roseovarius aestuarii]|uniref:DNA-binding transcriptional repressor MngR n=1 Tax=Roseovarius aestuarii TaxID=475083 RepID=A0A1X7BTS5_9RHOB|nr:winged helix-turn-helix domain-containing protein [Roseovarius aestuarii]SMC12995.1 DNA-binding transcriptional repressor MngR [Roseovarius aestuarii]
MSTTLEAIKTKLNRISEKSETRIKHRLLADSIMELLEDGTLQAGDHLPTEAALAEGLPFSLGTIQKALRNLSELGVVNRKSRTGTVIAEKTEEIFDLWQFRFVNDATDTLLPVYSKVTEMAKIQTRGPWSEFLGDEDFYVRITREIDVDHRFKLMNFFYLSDRQFGSVLDLGSAAFEGVHLHAVIRQEFGIGTVRTNNRVVCAAFPDPVSLRLDLPSAARGIICDILGFASSDKPLFFQQVYVPAHADPMEFRELRP